MRGDTLTFVVVSQPANGSVVIAGDMATYIPKANFNGQDDFSFMANDGSVDSNIARVTINVTDVNDAPEALAASVTVDEDTTLEITLFATDADGGSMTYEVVTQPTLGSLSSISGNKVIYTPAGNANGTDSFSFKANDGITDSETVATTIIITPVNDAPLVVAQAVTLDEDMGVTIVLKGSDLDGDALTYSVVEQPESGLLSEITGNTLTYSPRIDFYGSDSFTFKANDGIEDSDMVTVMLTVVDANDPSGRINDTGIDLCSGSESIRMPCPIAGYPDQDAEYGRDFTHHDDSDGHAGFSFTKLDANGIALSADANSWSCVVDNVTGLTWEIKQGGNGIFGDEGLHDADDAFTWYTTDTSNDGGFDPGIEDKQTFNTTGYAGDPSCFGYNASDNTTFCNTQAYVRRVNAQTLCGVSDWHLPSGEEVNSIRRYDVIVGLQLDINYFRHGGFKTSYPIGIYAKDLYYSGVNETLPYATQAISFGVHLVRGEQ